jgi:hypothetical protein
MTQGSRNDRPNKSESSKSTIKIQNRILANSTATDAMPPKPNTAAMMAMISNAIDVLNIFTSFLFKSNKSVGGRNRDFLLTLSKFK